MKKNITKPLLIMIVGLVFLFSACEGTKVPSTEITPEVTAEPLNNLGKFVAVVPQKTDIDYSAGNEIAKQKIIDSIAADRDVALDFETIELDENNFSNDLNEVLASTYIDSITADYDMLSTYASVDGLIQPIDTLLETYGPNLYNAIDESYWKDVTYNGHIYGIPSVPYPEKSILVTRSDILYMFATEPISTYSELIAVCRFYKDMGYEYPLAITWDQLIDVLAFSLRVAPFPYMHEGNGAPFIFRMREDSQNYNDYFIDEIKLLYDNGFINPNIFTATEEQMKEEFMAGKSAIYVAEYDDIYDDREQLKSVFPNAEMQIIQPLTSRYQSYPIVSGEEKIDKVLMITQSSQNAEALITYLDWAYSSQLNYNMLKLGAYGEQLMYNPALNEFEYLNGYSLDNKPYDGLYTLGLSTDFLYTPPTYVEYTIDIIARNTLEKEFNGYLHNTKVRYCPVPVSSINEKAKTALDEYQRIMRTATEQYIKGDIDIDEYNAYRRETRNTGLLDVLMQEIGIEYIYKIENPDK